MQYLERFFRSALYKKTILPITLMSGTIIGAGIFSLPFIFSVSGWLIGVGYLIAFAVVFYLVHIMYADVILRSKEKFKFVGYAKRYLGELAFWMSILVTVIGSLLTLTAYLVLIKSFLGIIFPQIISLQMGVALFWILGSLAILLSIKRMARIEFLITLGIIAIIFFIFLFGIFGNPFKVATLPKMNLALFFLPFGPILFSLSGRTAVPAVIEYYENNKMNFDNFKLVMFWGTFIPVIIYFLFIVGIVGISNIITADSVQSINNLPLVFPWMVGILGLLSLLSSYIVIGLSIDEILNIDLNIPKLISRLAVIALPLLFLFIGFNDFIKIISLAGGIFLALEGIIVVSMWRRMESLKKDQFLFIEKKLPKITSYILIAVFFIGVLYTAIY